MSFKNIICVMSRTWSLKYTLLPQILMALKYCPPSLCDAHWHRMKPLWSEHATQQLSAFHTGSQKWQALNGTRRIKWLITTQSPLLIFILLEFNILCGVYTLSGYKRWPEIFNAYLLSSWFFCLFVFGVFLASYWNSVSPIHTAV